MTKRLSKKDYSENRDSDMPRDFELMAGLISGLGLDPTEEELVKYFRDENALDFMPIAKDWLARLRKEAVDPQISKFDGPSAD